MVGVTVHGGVGEIGGNKVMVDAEHGRILLDFGTSFGAMAQYYCEFCGPRNHSYLGDQLYLGLLPQVDGIYREDLVRKAGMEHREELSVDGVFISHAHVDHVGMVPVLRPEIGVNMLAESKAILETLDEANIGIGLPDKFLALHEKFKLIPKKRGEGLKKGSGKDVEVPRNVNVMDPGVELEAAPDISVRAEPVDHSLPGAAGFVVHVDGQTWVYTGDLRFHGTHSELSRDFVKTAASEDVDVLITEGTRVTEEQGRTEAQAREEVTALIEGTRGMVLANYPGRDLDRIISFYQAARAAGRELVIDLRQSLLLENLAKVAGPSVPRFGDGLRVMPQRRTWAIVGDPGFPEDIQAQDYDNWQKGYAFSSHRVLDNEIGDEPDRYVVFVDFFHLQALIDLRPGPGSSFIRSMVEPFNEEMLLDKRRVDNWMRRFDLEVHQVHASGHACDDDLRWIIDTVQPRVVVPIHTERPQAFGPYHPDVRPPQLGVRMDL
jgi:ribonuclease J